MSPQIAEPRTSPTVEMILNAIANWIKKYRYAAGLHQELAGCGADEVARIARDLGIDTAELFKLSDNGPGAADLLQRMLRALGADPNTLALIDPLVMRDLQRLCISCSHKKRCEHDLAAETAAQNYREYCPNAVSLDALFEKSLRYANTELTDHFI
jgi:transcriptional regulator with XRE-family HTH domain